VDPRFAYDAYRRLFSYSERLLWVLMMKNSICISPQSRNKPEIKADVVWMRAFTPNHELFLLVVLEENGKPFPENVYEQLELSIKAVFNSWMGKRAVDYRREFHISRKWQTYCR